MTSRPMIFNTDMVRAILSGSKLATRRPITIPSGWELKDRKLSKITSNHAKKGKWGALIRRETFPGKFEHDIISAPCIAGDILYVRETFRLFDREVECACYDHCNCPATGTPIYLADTWAEDNKWTPSIHMPKKLSRLSLKVTDVRIETLSDLSANTDQVNKEGFQSFAQFEQVWSSIYGSCNPNDYVWVIEFGVIKNNIDE